MSATNFWLNTINAGKLLEPDNCPEWHPTPGGSDQLTTGVCYYYLLQRMSGCHDGQPIRGQFGLTPANQRAALHLRWSHVTPGWAHTGQVSSLWGLTLIGPIRVQHTRHLTNPRLGTFLPHVWVVMTRGAFSPPSPHTRLWLSDAQQHRVVASFLASVALPRLHSIFRMHF